MDSDTAMEFVERARKIGASMGLSVTVAVHDAAGHPVVVFRGSHKWHGPYMAMGKARLSAAFQRPTADLIESWRDRPLFPTSLVGVLPGEITLNPGGHPIFVDGVCIGAIGVGGGSPEQDATVARMAAEGTERMEGDQDQ